MIKISFMFFFNFLNVVTRKFEATSLACFMHLLASVGLPSTLSQGD